MNTFLDISKSFDRVCYEGLIRKLQSLGMSGLPLKSFEGFLTNRFERVKWPIIFVVTSTSRRVSRLQESILADLSILMHINDLSKN